MPRPALYIAGSAVLSILALFAGLWLVRASMPELRTIAEDDDGIRLDRWFKRHYPALTHGRLEKLLRKGEVRLDGKRAKAADRVTGGPERCACRRRSFTTRREPQAEAGAAGQDLAQAGRRDPLHGQASHRPEQAAGPGDPGRLGPQGACRRHAGPAQLTKRPSGPSWCIGWTAIPPACCWWRARRRRPPGLSRALASRDASKVYWALVKGVPKQKHGLVKARAGQGRRARQGRAHDRSARKTTPNSPSPNMP